MSAIKNACLLSKRRICGRRDVDEPVAWGPYIIVLKIGSNKLINGHQSLRSSRTKVLERSRMVEVAGIEPASSDIKTKASTCLSYFFIFPFQASIGGRTEKVSFTDFTLTAKGNTGEAILLVTPIRYRRLLPVDGLP